MACSVKLGREITQCSTGRLVGRNHFAHRIPTMHTKEKGKCQHTCKVCADRRKCYTGNSHGSTPPSTVEKCENAGLCLDECFHIYHTNMNYWD
jgi:hypothetical protein